MTPEPPFADALLTWFDVNGRHDLPWQHPRTAYRVWLSEIMLQQTQVSVAAPYFLRFVDALPDLAALAAAPQDTVLALWSGLGYYARARNLHAAARLCAARHDGELPRDFDALCALPGIGRSTAGAILAQAWGERFAILDGNVRRVLCRVNGVDGWPGTPAVQKTLWTLAEAQLPHARLADYTQAQMDFGATLCTRRNPACVQCPLQARCVARLQGRVDELPFAKPSKPVPQREAIIIFATDHARRVLLQRRPPTGVWASLWSLPQAEDKAAARDWFMAHLRAEFDKGDELPAIEHAFTHYRLRLRPRRWEAITLQPRVRDNDGLRWVAMDELPALGIPAPIRQLLLTSMAKDAAASDQGI